MDTIRFVRDNFDMTMLLIEHDMSLVCRYLRKADCAELRSAPLSRAETAEVLKNPEVITAYLGE